MPFIKRSPSCPLRKLKTFSMAKNVVASANAVAYIYDAGGLRPRIFKPMMASPINVQLKKF